MTSDLSDLYAIFLAQAEIVQRVRPTYPAGSKEYRGNHVGLLGSGAVYIIM